MNYIDSSENRIRCGRCSTEFDLNKNREGCPLCGFGEKKLQGISTIKSANYQEKPIISNKYLSVPPKLTLEPGKVNVDQETNIWGSWLMFNDFFAPKFLSRILAWKMYEENKDHILLSSLMKDAIKIIKKYRLSYLKGFPNLKKDWQGERLVDHFLTTFVKMGFIEVKSSDDNTKNIWKEEWNKIKVYLTREGLEFARIINPIYDENKNEQILGVEERKWLIDYLKRIDKQGYKEYSVLKEVYDFLKLGNNGNKDLWRWFVNNQRFRNYIPNRSKKAKEDAEVFERQMKNYSRSFSSAKISLLRELGVIKNKRNDYTIEGRL